MLAVGTANGEVFLFHLEDNGRLEKLMCPRPIKNVTYTEFSANGSKLPCSTAATATDTIIRQTVFDYHGKTLISVTEEAGLLCWTIV